MEKCSFTCGKHHLYHPGNTFLILFDFFGFYYRLYHVISHMKLDYPLVIMAVKSAMCHRRPQTASLALRASEDWERSICENRAFAILRQLQTGRFPYIKKEGCEMLVAMVLDRPLAEAQSLVPRQAKNNQRRLSPPRLTEACLARPSWKCLG